MPDPRRSQPQIRLPQGCVTVDVDHDHLIPHLDRLLREACGAVPLFPPLVALPSPTSPPPAPPAAAPRRELKPNHHLWNNNGVWFAIYTIYPTPVTKERIRESLGTRCLETARIRRDAILAERAAQGVLATVRCPLRVQASPFSQAG